MDMRGWQDRGALPINNGYTPADPNQQQQPQQQPQKSGSPWLSLIPSIIGEIAKPFIQGINTIGQQSHQVANTGKMLLADATGNREAWKNANEEAERDYAAQKKGEGGLFNMGGYFSGEEARQGDLETGVKRIGGKTAQQIATVAPVGGGGAAAMAGKAALAGGVGGAGEALAEDKSLEDILMSGVTGAGVSGVTGGVLGKLSKAVPESGGASVMDKISSFIGRKPTAAADDVTTGILKKDGQVLDDIMGGLQKSEKSLNKAGTAVDKTLDSMDGTSSGVRGWLADKLNNASDRFSLSASKVGNKKAAMAKFREFGGNDKESLAEFLRRSGNIGSSADDIERGFVADANKRFGDAIGTIKRDITPSDVLANNRDELEKLMRSDVPQDQRVFKEVQAQLKQIFNKRNGKVSPKELNSIKANYDAHVNYKSEMSNPEQYGVDKRVADYLRKTLQGVSGDDAMRQAGLDISKGHRAAKIIGEAAENGKGNLGFGMTDALTATAGAAMGGAPGAIAGTVAKRIYNSPRVQSFIANKLANKASKLASKTSKGGSKLPGKISDFIQKGAEMAGKTTLPGIAATQALQGLGGDTVEAAGADQEMPNEFDTAQLQQQPGANDGQPLSGDAAFQQDQATLAAMLNGGQQASDQPMYTLANMQKDIARDPEHANQYMQYYAFMKEQTTPENAADQMSQSSKNAMASSDNAINTVDQLESMFDAAGGGGGRVGGWLKNTMGSAGFNENAKVYNDMAKASVTQIAKALAGSGAGTVSDMDAKVIMDALATFNNTPAEAKAKFAALRQRLMTARKNTELYGAGDGSQESGGQYDLQSLLGG